MRKLRMILRIVFFLLTVMLVVYLNRKADDNARSVVEFKFEMFQKMRNDSLDSRKKAEFLIDETTKFVEDSSHVKKGISYLMMLIVIAIITEVVFVVVQRRSPGD